MEYLRKMVCLKPLTRVVSIKYTICIHLTNIKKDSGDKINNYLASPEVNPITPGKKIW